MNDKSTAEKLVEAHAEALKEESALFDGDESLDEVVRVVLEQARGVRDENGDIVTSTELEVRQKQAELRDKIGLSESVNSESEQALSDPVARKQAELQEKILD